MCYPTPSLAHQVRSTGFLQNRIRKVRIAMQLLTHPSRSPLCNWGMRLGSTVTASLKNISRGYVAHNEHSRFDNEGPQLHPAGKIPALQNSDRLGVGLG